VSKNTQHRRSERQDSQAFAPEVNMADGMQKNWCELCVAVTNESEDTKLSLPVQQLIEAFDQGERRWRHTLRPPDASATNQEAA
jgi:hypothetical protein